MRHAHLQRNVLLLRHAHQQRNEKRLVLKCPWTSSALAKNLGVIIRSVCQRDEYMVCFEVLQAGWRERNNCYVGMTTLAQNLVELDVL